jgi:hypothetical protein
VVQPIHPALPAASACQLPAARSARSTCRAQGAQQNPEAEIEIGTGIARDNRAGI